MATEGLYYDILNSRSKDKIAIDNMDIWVRFVARPISFLVTYPLMKIGITANAASVFSIIISLMGFLSVLIFKTQGILAALLIFNFWIVFDAVDGNIARTLKKSSVLGTFIDAISGYVFLVVLYVTLGLSVYLQTDELIWLIMGFVTSLMVIFPRLVLQKKIVLFGKDNNDASAKNKYKVKELIALNIAGPAGLMNPIMVIAYIFNQLPIYLMFYSVIQVAIGSLTILNTVRSVKSYVE